MKIEGLFTIGKLAKEAGVKVQTIRYYERLNLLLPTKRKESLYGVKNTGYRLYDERGLKRFKFIRHAKGLGLTLKEIKELLNLSVSPTAKCKDIRKKTEERLMDVNKKIEGLESLRGILKGLIKSCRSRKSTEECPILKAIDEDRWQV